MPECLECTKELGWWLDRADFYDPRWFPGIKYFDSFEELLDLSKKELDVDEHRSHLDGLRRRTDEVPLLECVLCRKLCSLSVPQRRGSSLGTELL